MQDKDKITSRIARIARMVSRWAGQRGTFTRENTAEGEVLQHAPPAAGEMDAEQGVYIEPPKALPVLAQCEVLVVGAGPAGLSAALAARRAGADVVLLERYGCFGGAITTVGMETLAWYRYEGTVESEGIGIEMERRAAAMGGTVKWPYNDSECLDADFFKVVADHLVRESGIRPILHCYAVDVIFEEGTQRLKGIVTESKSGRQVVLAQRIIDCTGDADIAHLAGASYRKTPKDKMLGMTTVFNASGVDKDRFVQYTEAQPATYADWSRTWEQTTSGKENHLPSPYLDKEFDQARALGVIPQGSTNIGGSWSSLTDAGEANNLNLAHMYGYDPTDVNDLTRAEMQGRQEALHALTALKAVVPGFEKAKLRNFSMTIGVRDSRKIIGRTNLTGEHVRNQAKFADSVGIFPEFIDGYAVLILPTTGRYFEVPYGCMVPLEVDNLLVAGRCVAGDMVSHAAMRNMMACTVTGQGAGVAAAVSLQRGQTTANVDMVAVQSELEKQGVRLH
jgi:ribulose 1,5-bisphosphate synthetase/thiazole synthase